MRIMCEYRSRMQSNSSIAQKKKNVMQTVPRKSKSIRI